MSHLGELLVSCEECLSARDFVRVKKLIEEAHSKGWTSIGLWEYSDRAKPDDLCGINPITLQLDSININTLATGKKKLGRRAGSRLNRDAIRAEEKRRDYQSEYKRKLYLKKKKAS